MPTAHDNKPESPPAAVAKLREENERLKADLEKWQASLGHDHVENYLAEETIRRRMAQAKAERERLTLLETLLATFKAADDERLIETHKAHDEAEKWKAEGDMYGWNFHQGRSGGITWGSIVFFRVQRAIEDQIKAAKLTPPA